MTESQRLLAEFRKTRSEPAFRELVDRFIDIVHSTALRLMNGDRHHAEDITQTVFADLAKLSSSLRDETMLGGWLHRHTCFVAAKAIRTERRRRLREEQAVAMNELYDKPIGMAEIASLLDEAINELAPDDRQAILLRFYEQRNFRSVGEAMRTSENAAQKRVSRALDQLHVILARRGVTLSATALGTVLASEVVTAAPAGLAGAVTAAAIAEAASLGGLASLGVITMTKANILLIGGLIAASTLTPMWLQHRANTLLRSENEALRVQVAANSRALASNLANPDGEELNQLRRQHEELLRLRARVGSLQRAALVASATAQTSNSVVLKEPPRSIQLRRRK